MAVPNDNELMDMHREYDPLLWDQVKSRADELIGPIDNLTPEDLAELAEYERRANRLQPSEMFAPGSLGSPGIPGNPYAIDTTGAMTGLANATTALINRNRQRQVEGDPKTVQRAQDRESELMQRADDQSPRAEEIRRGGGPLSGLRSTLAQGRAGLTKARAGRQGRRAERFKGFADAHRDLTNRQQRAAEQTEAKDDFMMKFYPEAWKRVMDATVQDRHGERQHGRAIEQIEARGEQQRETASWTQELKNDPSNRDARNLGYQEVRDIILSRHPESVTLRNDIDNLTRERNRLAGSSLSRDQGRADSLKTEIEAKEKEWERVQGRIHKDWLSFNPSLRDVFGEKEIDDMINDPKTWDYPKSKLMPNSPSFGLSRGSDAREDVGETVDVGDLFD